MLTKKFIKLTLLLALLVGLITAPALAKRGKGGSRKGGRTRTAKVQSSRGHSQRRSGNRGALRQGSTRSRSGALRQGSTRSRSGALGKSSIRSMQSRRRDSHMGSISTRRHDSSISRRGGLKRSGHTGRIRRPHNRSNFGHRRRHSYSFYFGAPYGYYYYNYPYYGYPYRRYYYYYRPGYYYGDPYYYPYDDNYEKEDYQDKYYDPFEQVREKMKKQQNEEQAKLNYYLEDIAVAFEVRHYQRAVVLTADAVKAEPDNRILPFVYTQALFANYQYGKAADVLRKALLTIEPDKQQVFYIDGLYSDRDVLTEQIKKLTTATEKEPQNADLQLLLGYQLLGEGRFSQAQRALQNARKDYVNKDAAGMLEKLFEKTRRGETKK